MKVAILGASGIIGQHLMISVPEGVEAVFTSRTGGPLFEALNVTDPHTLSLWLDHTKPTVVVNLMGENRPDEVEKNPCAHALINTDAVRWLASWCGANSAHLIHVSSQAVLDPVNAYGRQKVDAEHLLQERRIDTRLWHYNWTIIRPTFILGIRPFPGIGRENPAERMLSGLETYSVCDRSFSVSFAWDIAAQIWRYALEPGNYRRILQVGLQERLTRCDVAALLGCESTPVKHDSLGLAAPRPLDTTYTNSVVGSWSLSNGILRLKQEWGGRKDDDPAYRAQELAAFLRIPYIQCLAKLTSGFGGLHAAVTEDFNRANPQTNEELLNWYRTTDAYLWELTAYHSDPGFNYAGMIKGIIERLKSEGVRDVLCLGDGTGDLTLACAAAGFHPTYTDLVRSRIWCFALARFAMRLGTKWDAAINALGSGSWTPPMLPAVWQYDAIVSLDFLEHVPNVEQWAYAIWASLKPGGLFCAQNAFAMGSGPQGSMPMHLAVNDRFEKDWDPLLFSIGFVQEGSNWYRKPL